MLYIDYVKALTAIAQWSGHWQLDPSPLAEFYGGRGGGGHGISLPPRNLEIEYGYNVLSQVLNNNLVPDCNLRGFKFKIFLGEHAPRPPSRHTSCMSVLSRATIILLLPCSPPPPPPTQILYETLARFDFI